MINFPNKKNFAPSEGTQGSAFSPLPAGAYVGKIYGARVEDGPSGQRLAIQVDVEEGEFAGYFHRRFNADQGGRFTAKYKGVTRMNIPDANTDAQRAEWQQRALEGFAWALEQANEGYHWDWDESRLAGLSVGFTVREKDYFIPESGNSGTTTEIFQFWPVGKVRAGEVRTPKKRELSAADRARMENAQQDADMGMTPANNEPLPF
jgi:hypothetical protein